MDRTGIRCNKEIIVKLIDNLLSNLDQGQAHRVNQILLYLKSLDPVDLINENSIFLKLMSTAKILPFRYSAELVTLLRPLGLLNMGTRQISLNGNPILKNIRDIGSKFSVEFSAFDNSEHNKETFWICKGNHSTNVLEIIFEIEKYLIASESEFICFFTNKNYPDLLFGSLNKKNDSINQLFNVGMRTVMSAIDKTTTKYNDVSAIVAEVYNFIVLNSDYLPDALSRLLDDTLALFVEKKTNLTNSNGWILLYTFIDILLNIARVSTIDIVLRILDFFKSHVYDKSKARWGFYTLTNQIVRNNKIMLKIRLIEAIALVARFPQIDNLSEGCHNFLLECSNNHTKWNLSFLSKDLLLDCLKDASILSEDLLNFPRRKQPFDSLKQLIFQNYQHVLSQFPAISTTNYEINDVIIDELKASLSEVYNRLDNSLKIKYWPFFCLSLLIEYELQMTTDPSPPLNANPATDVSPLPRTTMVFDQNHTLKSDWGYEDYTLALPQSLPSAPFVKPRESDTIFPPLPPPSSGSIFSAADYLQAGKLTDDLDIQSRIALIQYIISQGKRITEVINGRNLVMVIGATGCGKSTTLNWLLGCTMMMNETTGSITVKPRRLGGIYEELCPIGDNVTVSKTIVPTAFELVDSLYLCDAPGFLESRCPEISIANAVNIISVITVAESVGFLLLFSYFDLRGARANAAKESLLALQRMFGSNGTNNSNNEGLQKHSDCIILGITHATSSQFIHAKNILCDLCNEVKVVVPLNHIIHIDQLERENESISKPDLEVMMYDMKKVRKETSRNIFTDPALNEKDMALITEIATQLRVTCEEYWNRQQVASVVDSFLLLQSLSVIGSHPSVSREITSLRDFILRCVQEYITINILEVVRLPLEDNLRTTIFANMHYLSSLIVLDACFPSNEISLIITNTRDKVKEIEEKELSARNFRLGDTMQKMLSQLTIDLNALLGARSEYLAYFDVDSDMLRQLESALPILVEIMKFKSCLSNELEGRKNIFLHAALAQSELQQMVRFIEVAVEDMINCRVLPAQIQHISNILLQQLKGISIEATVVVETWHTSILELKMKVDESTAGLASTERKLELRLQSVFDAELGLDQTKKLPLLSSFSSLQKVFNKTPVNQSVTELYQNVITTMIDFWENIMTQALHFEKNMYINNLQAIQTSFAKATQQERSRTDEFDLSFLLKFPLLAGHVKVVKRSLPLLPNSDEERLQISQILGKLELDMLETVRNNLSSDVTLASDKFLQDMTVEASRDRLCVSLLALQKVDAKRVLTSIDTLVKKFRDVVEPEVCQAITTDISQYTEMANRIFHKLQRFDDFLRIAGNPNFVDYIAYKSSVNKRLQIYENTALENATAKINESAKTVKQSIQVGIQKFIELKSTIFTCPISLENPDTTVTMLREAGCLPIDVPLIINDLDKLAKTTKQALVITNQEALKLSESLEKLKREILQISQEGHASLAAQQGVNKCKANMTSLIALLDQTLERNAQFLCECIGDELTLLYLRKHQDYTQKANDILYDLSSLSIESRNHLIGFLKTELAAVRMRVVVLYSNQVFSPVSEWMIADTIGDHVEDIVRKFDTLRQLGVNEVYITKKKLFLSYFNSMQSKEKIDNLMSREYYSAILSLRELLLTIQKKLRHHNFEFDLKPLLEATRNFMNNKYNLAIDDIDCPTMCENFLNFSNLKVYMEVCHQMRSIHPDDVRQLKTHAKAVFSDFFSPENKQKLLSLSSIQNDRTETDIKTLVYTAKQFVKYFAIATELSMRKDFIEEIGAILGQIRGPATDTLSRLISELQSEKSLSEVCGDILSSFKVFSRVNIARQNELASGVIFPIALDKLVSNPPGVQSVLSSCKAVFDEVYETSLTSIDKKNYGSESQLQIIKHLANALKADCFQLSNQPENAARLLAYVCAHFCYIDSQDTYYNIGNKNNLFQMHATQVLAIFLILGLDTPGPVKGHINEILTGEGKSIILAMVAAVYALLGEDTKIVCYSTYLTTKDREIFQGFFSSLQIRWKITYCTINDLGDAVRRESFPDLRSEVLRFLKGESVPVFKGKAGTGVILIDEVDIFFGEDFYGATVSPAITLKSAEAVAFMRYLWKNRVELLALRADEAVQKVNSSAVDIIKNLCEKYPRLRSLLPCIIKKCHNFLQYYHSVPGKSQYNCFINNDKIASIDGKSGGIVYYVGNQITFEYFFQHEQLQPDGTPSISAKSLEENIEICLTCGNVLYSELPKLFRVVHGVSGTLAYFQEEQNAILANYGLERRSLIPSTFTKLPLNVVPTTIYSGDRDDVYFDKIKEVLLDMVLKRRATLVFFYTHELLESFRSKLNKNPIKSAACQGQEVLSEYLPGQKRDYIINRAINTGKITLSTKMFMRGTDFICRDSQLRRSGGVHILLTFYPDSEADEVQARGRTCRQNDPGSFQMILFAQDLVDRGFLRTRKEGGQKIPDLSETDEELEISQEEESKRYDIFLAKKRKEKSAASAKRIITKLEENTPRHQKTLRMSQLISEDNLEALTLLEELQR